ncbi:MAG: hypothetical protein FJ296_03525 [Planctomycetes bacterium]|nr:hypothetical protein [Planctomycetota bacterium]
MRIRNVLPAALLVLAACTASTTPTASETESVGLKPCTKACATKSADCSGEKKAECSAEAAKACAESKGRDKAAGDCSEGGKVDG